LTVEADTDSMVDKHWLSVHIAVSMTAAVAVVAVVFGNYKFEVVVADEPYVL
jgi:hypothetical protein